MQVFDDAIEIVMKFLEQVDSPDPRLSLIPCSKRSQGSDLSVVAFLDSM